MTSSEVSQIRIGRHRTGLVGFKTVLQEMAASHAQASDERVAAEMIKRLSRKNYIADSLHDRYGRAFVREFRKYMGQPYEEDASSGCLEIRVLGAGCNICDSLENDLMEVLAEMGLPANLEHIKDSEQMAKYGAKGLPALVMNGKIVSVGSTPTKKELKRLIEATGIETDSGGPMESPVFIKNIPLSEVHRLVDMVDYEQGRVVSRTFAQKAGLSLTLFAFDAGEGISTHTAPGDAMVQVLDGKAVVNIDGKELTVGAGQVAVMPANVPHSVTAVQQFKMLLTVVK